MSKYKVGEKVSIEGSKTKGMITAIHEGDIWNMYGGGKPDYTIELENGSGAVTVAENAIESMNYRYYKVCECGVAAVKGNRHSDYCPLYGVEDEEK